MQTAEHLSVYLLYARLHLTWNKSANVRRFKRFKMLQLNNYLVVGYIYLLFNWAVGKNNPSIPSEKISKFQLCNVRRIKKCPAKKSDIVDCFTNNQIQIHGNTKINVNLLHTVMFPRLSCCFILQNAFSLLNDCKFLYIFLFHLHCTKWHCLRGHLVFVHGLDSVFQYMQFFKMVFWYSRVHYAPLLDKVYPQKNM